MLLLLLLFLLHSAIAQINLGSFNFRPSPNGWNVGMGQGANILGFGGDRSLQLGVGPGHPFGMQTGGGALVAGERIGLDSGLGVESNGGFDLGSKLNFGNNPQPMVPGGQFAAFLDNIRRFFAGLAPAGGLPQPLPSPMQVTSNPHPTLRPQVNTEGAGNEDERMSMVSGGSSAKSGEVLSSLDGENDKVDKIFERITEKPRQLPGLVEFGEE